MAASIELGCMGMSKCQIFAPALHDQGAPAGLTMAFLFFARPRGDIPRVPGMNQSQRT